MLFAKSIDTPIGQLLLIANEDSLLLSEFDEEPIVNSKLNTFAEKLNLEISKEENSVLKKAEEELNLYFKKELTAFTIPLSPVGTEFQKNVWSSLQEIPFGKMKTYKIQSEHLNSPDAIRAIASANGKNPVVIIIPCHRVIGSDGTLTGYAGGLWRKKWLLQHEGSLNAGQGSLF